MFKNYVQDTLNSRKESLNNLSRYLWEHPETAFNETLAHDYLTNLLEQEGFDVQKNYILPTAFKAEYSSTEGGLCVALCCEYDALPEIGQACGHNLIAETAVGAGIAVKEVLKRNQNIYGKIVIIGTPAEETGSGKQLLLDQEGFNGVDVALMAHPVPEGMNIAKTVNTARITIDVTYKGKASHAGARPWEGVNALDAGVAAYVNISMLRQQLKPTWRVHANFIKGGSATNIIPDETKMQFMLRAPNSEELEDLYRRADHCFQSAATATGCSVSTRRFDEYLNMVSNGPLEEAYTVHAESLGIKFSKDPSFSFRGGSTDMGNVSQSMPAIHPMYSICTTASNHTPEFTEAAGKPQAQEPTLIAAASLALTALDVFTDPGLGERAFKEFRENTATLAKAS